MLTLILLVEDWKSLYKDVRIFNFFINTGCKLPQNSAKAFRVNEGIVNFNF